MNHTRFHLHGKYDDFYFHLSEGKGVGLGPPPGGLPPGGLPEGGRGGGGGL
jgi:hypothetical protein